MSTKYINTENTVSVFSQTVNYTPQNIKIQQSSNNTVYDYLNSIAEQKMVDMLYPIGTILTFVFQQGESDLLNPQNHFPWTEWVEMHGTLLGDNEKYPLGSQGGEAYHTLTVQQMPAHLHFYNAGSNSSYKYTQAQLTTDMVGVGPNTNYNSAPTGGGQPHLNLQPYEKVVFFKRVS